MPILALHGFTGCGADFASLAELVGGVWHCPDLPGHGANADLDCSPEATLNFIEKERSAFNAQHPTPNILLGYSMGARAALLHAAQFPDTWDALILISGNPGIEDETERNPRRGADSKLAERIEFEGVESFLDYWQNTPLIRDQQNAPALTREAMQANRRQHKTTGLASSLRQFGQGACPNLWPALKKLQLPILLITGQTDGKYTGIAQRMSGQLPRGTCRIIQNSGHAPHIEQTEVTSHVLRGFLKTQCII